MLYKINKENIRKIALFDNSTKKYSLSKIKQLTGCTTIINCSLFNMKNLKPVTHLKVDGIVKVSDQYKYWGYAFNTNSKGFDMVTDYSLYDNYFTCVALVRESEKKELNLSSDLKGNRGRTAIGRMPNGDLIIYCSNDGNSGIKTPEKLQNIFKNVGAKDALMLDSGGSSQCSFNTKSEYNINSSRIVSNFFLIWEKDYGTELTVDDSDGEEEKPVEKPTEKPTEPEIDMNKDMPDLTSKDMWLPEKYTEPTEILKMGSKGDGVKWLQTILQRLGFLLEVDGNYGSNTLNAIIKFQKYWSMNQGEQVGDNTKKGLKEAIWGISASEKEIIRVATSEICRNEANNEDDKYILWYNNANKTSFATTVAWCAIFVSWCMRRAGIDEKVYPNYASCSAGCKIFEKNGVTKDPKNYNPKSGDLIFFDFNKDKAPEHTGIVFANDGTYVYTIEGNSSNAVKHNKYLLNNSSIYKYIDLQSQFK